MAGKKGITRTKHVDGRAKPSQTAAFGKPNTPSTINGGVYPMAYQRKPSIGSTLSFMRHKADSSVRPHEISERKKSVPSAHRKK